MVPPETEIGSLLDDCARATREFYPSISVACLQVHHMIPFLPLECRLSLAYGPRSQSGIVVKEGQDSRWSACAYVLEGHTGYCPCAAFSRDGGRLVTGCRDHIVRLWDVQTGALLQVMNGHSDSITSVAYSLNGTLVASGAADRTVRVWNAATGVQVGEYTGHSEEIQCVAFSADGLCIVSACRNREVHVWTRSEERRVGKERRSWWRAYYK